MVHILRNREIQIIAWLMTAIALVVIGFTFYFSTVAGWVVMIGFMLLCSCFLFFTKRRYDAIEQLSSYLREISNGNHQLDVRDHIEGELSILKNDIYKVTLMLMKQSALLQQDKLQLTDAISDISHQLKTPLTSMMVMSDLLHDSVVPAEKRTEFSHHIRVQLERMDWLITSLLKLSKIDAGTIQFKREQVVMKKLIQKALDPLLIPIDVKEIALNVIGDEDIVCIGDLNWTAEALINILKNAVEYTPTGGSITITYAENVLYYDLLIEDSGVGIAKEDLPHLFKRFYKGRTASEGSIGIGLAMAHSIITNQHGTIEVKSTEGSGTQFHIKLYKQLK